MDLPSLDKTGAENVEETISALFERTGYLHEELATEALFYIDRQHRKEKGEPLTEAEYNMERSEMHWAMMVSEYHRPEYNSDHKRKSGLELNRISSEQVSADFERLLEGGEYTEEKMKRDRWGDFMRKGKVLRELPSDVRKNGYVSSYVNQIWRNDFKPRFDDQDDNLHARLREWMWEQDDFNNVSYGGELEP